MTGFPVFIGLGKQWQWLSNPNCGGLEGNPSSTGAHGALKLILP